MKEKNPIKRDMYVMIREVIENSDVEDKEILIDFIDKQVNILDNKAEKAKERAAERRAAGDELRANVKSVLTNDFQTVDEITEQIEGEEITKAKVIARLGQLVKMGEVEKTDVKTEKGRVIKAYRIAE